MSFDPLQHSSSHPFLRVTCQVRALGCVPLLELGWATLPDENLGSSQSSTLVDGTDNPR